MLFRGSFAKKIVLALSFIILLPLLGFGIYTAQEERKYILLEKRDELYRLASLIELRITREFDVGLWTDTGSASREEQALRLNRSIQPVLDEMGQAYPAYGIGIVSHDLRLRVAMSPGAIQDWISESPPAENELTPYPAGNLNLLQTDSANWNKQPAMVVTRPIIHNGNYAGYVWADIKIEDIDRLYQNSIRGRLLSAFGIWVMSMLAVWFFWRRFKLSAIRSANQQALSELPQLVPLLETMVNIRNDYWREITAIKRLIDACSVAVAVVNQQGIIIAHNDRYAKILKRFIPSGQKLIGMSLRKVMERIELPEEQCVFDRILRGESGVEIHQKPKGAEWITGGMPLLDGTGQIQGAVLSVTDITDREKWRREMDRMDKLRVIGEMAASVAHEIRNPLTVVRGGLQLMALKAEDKSRYLLMIEELDRANNIIEEFISLAQNRTIVKTFCDINQIVTGLQPLLASRIADEACRLELELTDGLPAIFVSEKEIKQLIFHLCRNARDAIADDGRLILSTRQEEDCVALQIKDNGCGIAQENIKKLTEPFYTTKRNGTGLGLVICQSIVKQNDAELHIDSTEGVGTTVTVKFHLPEPAKAAGSNQRNLAIG